MQEPADTVCPCCGELLGEAGYCTLCFKKPDTDDTLDRVLARLTIGDPPTDFSIDRRWVRIGRDAANQIILNNDRYVSRYHAWVTYESERFWIEDLGSTNGTVLNGELVERREQLNSGDIIKIGETQMTFDLLENSDR